MKYLIIPTLKILLWLMVMIFYVFRQILYIIWHLKPNKYLLSQILKDDYYYYSARDEKGEFYSHRLNKTIAVTNSPLTYLKWIFKYGICGEMTDITKVEKEALYEYIKNNEQ